MTATCRKPFVLLSWIVVAASIFTPSVRSQHQCELPELQAVTPSDPGLADHFGSDIAVSGLTAVVGAFRKDARGADSGAAYIYRYLGSTWVEEQRLVASDGAAGELFGISCDISGDVAVVGATNPYDQIGRHAVYVFRYDGAFWNEEARLTASDGQFGDWFGYSVSINHDVIVVGAWGSDAACTQNPLCDSGAAYVFRNDGVQWVEEQKLLASDMDEADLFGFDVAISGDTTMVTSYRDDDGGDGSGSVYIFDFDGNTWSQTQKLVASDAEPGDGFGRDIDLQDGLVLVGAPFSTDAGLESGSAYIFRRQGATWIEEQKLITSDLAAEDRFGLGVSIAGDNATISSYHDDDRGDKSGSVYLFTYDGANWTETRKFLASDGDIDDKLGLRLDAAGGMVLVAAPWNDTHVDNAGSMYVFPSFPGIELVITPTIVSPGNLITFVTAFGAPNDLVMMVMVEIDGLPVHIPFIYGNFGPGYKWLLSGPVPPDFSDFTIGFKAFGLTRCGQVGETEEITVNFQ